jgi:hypothetical protein
MRPRRSGASSSNRFPDSRTGIGLLTIRKEIVMASLKIRHPKDGHQERANFAAFGPAKDFPPKVVIRGKLTAGGKTVYSYKTLIQPHTGKWVVYFKGVPDGDYKFEVVDDADKPVSAAPVNIKVRKTAIRGITIDYPPNKEDDICEQLVAYGSTDEPGTVQGSMTQAKARGMGTDPILMEDGLWVIPFQVAAGDGYTFKAFITGGGSSSTTDLTVVACS